MATQKANNTDKEKVIGIAPASFHLLAITMCYFLVSGLFAIVDWFSRIWGVGIIPDDSP